MAFSEPESLRPALKNPPKRALYFHKDRLATLVEVSGFDETRKLLQVKPDSVRAAMSVLHTPIGSREKLDRGTRRTG